MQFFASAVTTLQTLVVALGAGLAVWGVVNLLEGYGSDNAAAKSQGIKQLISEITADVPIAARAVCATVLSARMPAFRSQSFQQRFMDYPLSACGFEGRLISWYEKALCTVQSAFTIKRSYI